MNVSTEYPDPEKSAVIERATLDAEHARKFAKPWLLEMCDGSIRQFDTEAEACAEQRRVEGWEK